MKRKFLGLALTSTLAFSMLATSAFAGNVDAQLLDGLDSTDFALASDLASKADVGHSHTEYALTTHEHPEYDPVSHNHYYGKMTIVAKSGGEYTSPVDAMDNLSSWCGVPSALNPCLVKIMPGVYDIGTDLIYTESYVSLSGSGEGVTVIKGEYTPGGKGTIDNSYKSNISISELSIEGSSITAIKNYNSSSINISDVTFNCNAAISSHWTNDLIVSNISAEASRPIFHQGGSLTVNDAKLTIISGNDAGVRAIDMTTLRLNNLDINGLSGTTPKGIWLHESYGATNPLYEISNINIKGVSYGIQARLNQSVGVILNLRDIDINASRPVYGNGYGLHLGSSGDVNIRNVATIGTTSIGLFVGGGGVPTNIKIENSILGGTNTAIQTTTSGDSLSVANTKLIGTLDLQGATINCFDVYDANYTAVSCP